MCVEISSQQQQFNKTDLKNTKKVSYSLKKLLKQLFKQQKTSKINTLNKLFHTKKAISLESLESLENIHNANIEAEECVSLESFENDINERLSIENESCELEDFDFSQISAAAVPVHFVRTEHGTFFWTASSDIAADNDLIEPLYCATNNQLAVMQDRWAQA